MSRLDRHLCAAAGHAADADEPPDGSWAAALLWRTSWSAHAVDKLLVPNCDGDAMLLRVVSSRVVLLGAPFLVVLASVVR